MAESVSHRGPDDEGYYVSDHVGLANRRLSIIDLPGGHQPIHDEDEDLWITFNGEIFNYRELRRETEAAGHRYYTNSDTEVLVHLYEMEGPAMLDRLNGMWAFAIWDAARKELFLARDRLGVKPIYYAAPDGSLAFGSEIKSILPALDGPPEIDPLAIPSYLAFRMHYGDRTLFRGVRQLRAGHRLFWRAGEVTVEEWWDIRQAPAPIDPVAAARRLRALLEDATRRRLIADVPIGVFLSGGIDSSTVTGLAATVGGERVRTFSVGFDEASFNELPYARAVAEKWGTDHHESMFSSKDIIENIVRMTWHFDEPLIHSTGIAQYLISEIAKKYVKVALCGHGGDELFAGYEILHGLRGSSGRTGSESRWFTEDWLSRSINLIPVPMRRRSELLHRFAPADVSYVIETTGVKAGVRDRLYGPSLRRTIDPVRGDEEIVAFFAKAPTSEPLNRVLYVMQKTYLVGLLVTQDKMNMAASIENRVPLLDYRIVEFAATIPESYKIRDGEKKHLLKRAVKDLLPERVLTRTKAGFSAPERDWFRGELKEVTESLLTANESATSRYFVPGYVARKIAQHRRVDNSWLLWSLLAFELWHRIYIENLGDWTRVQL
jgi:asparagine synthase (glutamine-hydrolysing)